MPFATITHGRILPVSDPVPILEITRLEMHNKRGVERVLGNILRERDPFHQCFFDIISEAKNIG